MKVTVKTSGHLRYEEVTGEVLVWGSTVELFDMVPMQVPCVVLQTPEAKIEAISLRRQLFQVEVHVHLAPTV